MKTPHNLMFLAHRASETDDVEELQRFVQTYHVDKDQKMMDMMLVNTAAHGHHQCTAWLISQMDPPPPVGHERCPYAIALRAAAHNGHVDCVRLLIAVCDPTTNNSEALLRATEKDHLECVQLLIPVSDPQANRSEALATATACKHHRCVDVLWPVSTPPAALALLKEDYPDEPHMWMDMQHRIEAEQQNAVLANIVGTNRTPAPSVVLPKKM